MRIFNFDKFINEKYLTFLTADITIKIDIETSRHATDRYFRHGIEKGEKITEDEIIETLEQAIEPLTYAIIDGKLKVREAFVVKDTNTKLNLVCNLMPTKEEGNLKLVIITVMKKEDFKTYDQFVLEI